MRTTVLFTLFWALFSIKTTLASLQRVCELAGNYNSNLQLNYDDVSAIVNVSLLDKNKRYTSYKIHLFADWTHQFESEELGCQNAHLLPHTVYDITSENVCLNLLWIRIRMICYCILFIFSRSSSSVCDTFTADFIDWRSFLGSTIQLVSNRSMFTLLCKLHFILLLFRIGQRSLSFIRYQNCK